MIRTARCLLGPYSESQYDARERSCVVLSLVGLVAMAAHVAAGWPMLITTMAAVYTGAVFGMLAKRKTERGLWMLALLVGIGAAAFYLLILAMEIWDWWRGAISPPWWVAVDFAAALIFVKIAICASFTVFLQNRRLARP